MLKICINPTKIATFELQFKKPNKMKLSSSSSKQIEQAIRKALERFSLAEEKTYITDIHLQPNQTSGEFFIYDDNDKLLAEAVIEEWMTYTGDDFDEEVGRTLSSILDKMDQAGELNQVHIIKPYSFVQIDEEKETVKELLLMDDDTLLVNDELLKGLDEELDAFLKELLEK